MRCCIIWKSADLKDVSPVRYFDGAWYLATYPEVKREGLNPLVHYVEVGAKEGRLPRSSI